MEDVMEVHGRPLELPSLQENESFALPAKTNSNTFNPISPKDVCAAKKGWRVAAPGCDGVSIPQVLRCSDNILVILFNLVLASAYIRGYCSEPYCYESPEKIDGMQLIGDR